MGCLTKDGVCSSMGSTGCNKLNVFDWLSDVPVPEEDKRFVQVSFEEGSRKDFFINKSKLELYSGGLVTVEAQGGGFEVGKISLQGVLALYEIKKQKINIHDNKLEIKSILRTASETDLKQHQKALAREQSVLEEARVIVADNKLDMKISKVSVQSDEKKITFYYIADGRVDFRELIKQFSTAFKARVEMKQVSARKEASIVGGIGSCGRELCCSSWLSEPKNINVSAARYQDLSINTAKLNGQCGRLKCCLNYELDMYLEALKDFPEKANKVTIDNGMLVLIKKDVLSKVMYYKLAKTEDVFALHVEDVHKIVRRKPTLKELEKMNKLKKEEVTTLKPSLTAMSVV